jgi:hypothetical protein
MVRRVFLLLGPLFRWCVVAVVAVAQEQIVWKFDRLDQIGGHKTSVAGNPKVIETPAGKAIQFDGVGDALFVDVHPLAGARKFTWEVVFRPDGDGRAEQRFFHLQENGASNNRLLLETRLIEGRWCLDSYAKSATGAQTLIDRRKLHAADRWAHVAMVYDGREFRHYVNGELQGKALVDLAPQGEGQTSIGVRINRIDWFKGAMRMARFTRGLALNPEAFLQP